MRLADSRTLALKAGPSIKDDDEILTDQVIQLDRSAPIKIIRGLPIRPLRDQRSFAALGRGGDSADLDGFFEQRCDVDDRALVAGVDREERLIKIDMFADFFDFGKANREIDRVVCFLTTGPELD